MFVEHKEAIEITPAKVLKLSEAIRIGAKLRGQCVNAYFKKGRSCAIGAAAEAMFGVNEDTFSTMHAEVILRTITTHIASEVLIRNDEGESREQIADWLEGLGY